MPFSNVIGQKHIVEHLKKTVDTDRIAHAQLFVGKAGVGVLPTAIAYANYILNKEQKPLKDNTPFSHPDLHFAFPVTTSNKVKKDPIANDFLEEWRTFLQENPYGSLYNWYSVLQIENKQGIISVQEARHIVKNLALKAYTGNYKVLIIWMAEKMNTSAANALLKLIEEPPKNTVILLLAEEEEKILSTIQSRCQTIHFPPLTEKDIANQLLKQFHLSNTLAQTYAQQANGNFNTACHLATNNENENVFEQWIIFWVRSAFKAKGNKKAIQDLLQWSEEVATTGRETQKQFLYFSQEFFRQALLYDYSVKELVNIPLKSTNFSFEKFSPFIHEANILDINMALQNAIYHIERNGNAKIIFSDLAIQLTRFIHRKSGLKS